MLLAVSAERIPDRAGQRFSVSSASISLKVPPRTATPTVTPTIRAMRKNIDIDAGVVIADFSDYVDKYQRDAKRCPDDFLHGAQQDPVVTGFVCCEINNKP